MSVILGLNFGHDATAAIIRDNQLVCAISNERLSRKKKAGNVTAEMVAYVLKAANLRLDEIEYVAFGDYYWNADNYVTVQSLSGQELQTPQGPLVYFHGSDTFGECRVQIEGRTFRGLLINHHVCHCASAFYTSSFEKAACFSVDASCLRPEACSLFMYGEGHKLHYLTCPGVMIGNAYADFTQKLGLGWAVTKAGTTMALASFGTPSALAQEKWGEYARSWYERAVQDSDPVFIRRMWSELAGVAPHFEFTREQSDSQRSMDIAASMQFVFERTLVKNAQDLRSMTKHFSDANLCLSGGSFLNSNANMCIREETEFKNIHLFPGCGDDGAAVGAALYVNHHLLNNPRRSYSAHEYMYLGTEHPIPQVGEPYNEGRIAQLIADDGVVAWYQGRSEFGPRALGNRSFLADPRSPTIKDKMNSQIKKREWFRPFAPSVLSEHASELFEIDFESKLMLFIAAIHDPAKLPGISHVDNSARLQTVERDDNPRYYDLIRQFHRITGVPTVLNTSLNRNDEPLIEKPEEALALFNETGIEALVLGDRMLLRASG